MTTSSDAPNVLKNTNFYFHSPAAASSAAVLKNGSPNTSSPLMRVSPDGKKRKNSISKVLQSGLKDKRIINQKLSLNNNNNINNNNEIELKYKRMLPPASTTVQKLADITLNDEKNNKKRRLSNNHTKVSSSIKPILPTSLSSSSPSRLRNDSLNPSILLSSPIVSVQQQQQQQQQHQQQQESMMMMKQQCNNQSFPQMNSPLTPSSHFSSIIQSSPLYASYYLNQENLTTGNSMMTPSSAKRIYNFNETPVQLSLNSSKNIEDLMDRDSNLNSQDKNSINNTSSIAVMDIIAQNIAKKNTGAGYSSSLVQPRCFSSNNVLSKSPLPAFPSSSPVRPKANSLLQASPFQKSFSTSNLPIGNKRLQKSNTSNNSINNNNNNNDNNTKPVNISTERCLKLALKIDKEGKAIVEEEESNQIEQQILRDSSSNLTIKPSLILNNAILAYNRDVVDHYQNQAQYRNNMALSSAGEMPLMESSSYSSSPATLSNRSSTISSTANTLRSSSALPSSSSNNTTDVETDYISTTNNLKRMFYDNEHFYKGISEYEEGNSLFEDSENDARNALMRAFKTNSV
ncbi:hypothetical protein PACTADRAFT_15987 [Pachysolen tannophilus NRRL Y-2460]|uniref:Uncharacterized protein n=1 Tax=Pachysolen tannophilus NRRL Y-2460 TaxID=669874 RepID=A0A1E4TVI3_PACTA|nr:hypothetical protein PACTADRAFT_15987 [Pachysolen tannophilus NRRL Y-2460]